MHHIKESKVVRVILSILLLAGLNLNVFAICSACQLQLAILQANYYFIAQDFNGAVMESAALEGQIAANISQSLEWGRELQQSEDEDERNNLQSQIDCIDYATVQLIMQRDITNGHILGWNSDLQLIQMDINAIGDPCIHENTQTCDSTPC